MGLFYILRQKQPFLHPDIMAFLISFKFPHLDTRFSIIGNSFAYCWILPNPEMLNLPRRATGELVKNHKGCLKVVRLHGPALLRHSNQLICIPSSSDQDRHLFNWLPAARLWPSRNLSGEHDDKSQLRPHSTCKVRTDVSTLKSFPH